MDNIEALFESLNPDGDGLVAKEEILSWAPEPLQESLTSLLGSKNYIDLKGFTSACEALMNQQEVPEGDGEEEEEEEECERPSNDIDTIRRLFDKLDVGKKNALTADELVLAMPDASRESMEKVISQLNPSVQGQVSFEEFYAGFDIFVDHQQSEVRRKAREAKASACIPNTPSDTAKPSPRSPPSDITQPASLMGSPSSIRELIKDSKSIRNPKVVDLRRESVMSSRGPDMLKKWGTTEGTMESNASLTTFDVNSPRAQLGGSTVLTQEVNENDTSEWPNSRSRNPKKSHLSPPLPRSRIPNPNPPSTPASMNSQTSTRSKTTPTKPTDMNSASLSLNLGASVSEINQMSASDLSLSLASLHALGPSTPKATMTDYVRKSPKAIGKQIWGKKGMNVKGGSTRSASRGSPASRAALPTIAQMESDSKLFDRNAWPEPQDNPFQDEERESKLESKANAEDDEMASLRAKYESAVEHLEVINRKYKMLGRLGRKLEIENSRLGDQLAHAVGELETKTNDMEDLTERFQEIQRNYSKVLETVEDLREQNLTISKDHGATIESLEIEHRANVRIMDELNAQRELIAEFEKKKTVETRASRVTKMAQTKLLRNAMKEARMKQQLQTRYDEELKRSQGFQKKILKLSVEAKQKDELLKSLRHQLEEQKHKYGSSLEMDMGISPGSAARKNTARKMLARFDYHNRRKASYLARSLPLIAKNKISQLSPTDESRRRATLSFGAVSQLKKEMKKAQASGETLGTLLEIQETVSESLDDKRKRLESQSIEKERQLSAAIARAKQEGAAEFALDWRKCLNAVYAEAQKLTSKDDKLECSTLAQKIIDLFKPNHRLVIPVVTSAPPPTPTSVVGSEFEGPLKRLPWPEISLTQSEAGQITVLSSYLNAVLGCEPLLKKSNLIPLDPASGDLIHKVSNGLLLAVLINFGAPQTIDLRALNTNHVHDEKFHPFLHLSKVAGLAEERPKGGSISETKQLPMHAALENLTLVVESSKSIGVQVAGLRTKDLLHSYKYPSKVTHFIWRILSAQAEIKISLRNYPKLTKAIHISKGGKADTFDWPEAQELAASYSPPDLALAWATTHLQHYNTQPTKDSITSFSKPFTPQIISKVVEGAIKAQAKEEQESSAVILNDWNALRNRIDEAGAKSAGFLLCEGLEDAISSIIPKDRVETKKRAKPKGASKKADTWVEKARFAALATLLTEIPGFWPLPGESKIERQKGHRRVASANKWGGKRVGVMDDDKGSSRLERAFRMWINSMNAKGVYIHNLFADCRDGLVLLKVLDKMVPGSVSWRRVEKKPSNKFQKISNCNLVVQIAKGPTFKFSVVSISGDNIYGKNKKLTLAVVWQMMRFHLVDFLQSVFDAKFGKGDSRRPSSASPPGEGNRRASVFAGKYNPRTGKKKKSKAVLEGGDAAIIDWANKTVSKATGFGGLPPAGEGIKWKENLRIKTFKDEHLETSLYFFALLWAIDPYPVNWSIVTPGQTPQDRLLNASTKARGDYISTS
ncbi:hypothetical protein AAMO2058_000779900 [Amorphochlora amoebiformis]